MTQVSREINKQEREAYLAEAAIDAAGGLRALARLLGISFQAIQQWKKVPAERLLEIERVTGVARERLRPDLYRIDPPPRKRR